MPTLNEFLEKALKNVVVEAKRKEIRKHTIEIKLVDFSSDKDEPAFDVETWIDGTPVMGGGKKQVFSVSPKGDKMQVIKARQSALSRIGDILKQIKKIGEE